MAGTSARGALSMCSVLVLSLVGTWLTAADDADRTQTAPTEASSDVTRLPEAADDPVENAAQRLLARKLKQRIALADLDRDGRMDIAISDFRTDRVILLQGMPDGSFHRWGSLAAGRGPRALVAADFDSDGILDLAVTNFFSGTVAMFRGRGNGQFDAAKAVALAPGVASMVSEDLDRDGQVDLAVANALSRQLAVLASVGNGLFTTQDVESPLPDLAFLANVDIDRDRAPDLVAMDPSGATARRFDGRGTAALADSGAIDSAAVAVASSAASDGSHSPTPLGTLRAVAGDGEAITVSPAAVLTFAVQLSHNGSPIQGTDVQFLHLLENRSTVARVMGVTDEAGRATLAQPASVAAGLRAVVAFSASGELAIVSALAALSPATLLDRIEIALERSPVRSERRSAVRQTLTAARTSLDSGRAAAAISALAAATSLLASDTTVGGVSNAAIDDAEALMRVLVDQLLLLGAPSAATCTSLRCDVEGRGSIDAPVETDGHCFNVIDGERVEITVAERAPSGANFTPSWRLLTGAGAPTLSCGAFTTGARRECGPLPAAGNPYQVEIIDHLRDDTGRYAVHLYNLRAATACDNTAVSCDVPVAGTIDTAVESDLFRIGAVTDGERFQITVPKRAPSGLNFAPSWRLLTGAGTPAVSCGAFTTGLQRDCGPLPATGNPYQIEVMDHLRDDTGSYAVHLYRLRASTACDTTGVSCDVPVAGTIATALESDLFRIGAVTDGERLQITVPKRAPSGPNFAPSWRLLTGAGTPAVSCGAFTTGLQRDCGPLPATGNPYQIEVMDHLRDDTGSYAVHLYRLRASTACDTTGVSCDVPVAGTIATALESDLFRIGAVTDGERLQITVPKRAPSGLNFAPSWRLLTGAGTPAVSCGAFTTGLQRDCGPLPATGNPYQIEVMDHLRDDTGSYAVHLYRLRASTACDTTGVSCDVPVAGTIATALESDLFRIGAVTDGERLQITVPKRAPSGLNFAPSWRLLTGAGTPAVSCGAFTTGLQRDCGPLPATGNPYQIEVMDHLRDDTGSYAVHLDKLRAATACDSAAIRCGVPVAGTIQTALESDLFRLPNIFEGDRAQITVTERAPLGASFTPSWRLLTADGSPASSCGAFTTGTQRICGPLSAAGNPYQIEIVDHLRDDIGSYDVALTFVNRNCDSPPRPAPRMVIDAPTAVTIGLNVTFRWHLENPDPELTYQFEIRADKGIDACDNGLEEVFNAQTATCMAVALDPRRYSNQSAEFAIRALDSRGQAFCQRGGRRFVDPQVPSNGPCP